VLERFSLSETASFNVFVEGATDRDLLTFAARLALESLGVDLLAVPPSAGPTDHERLAIVTPLNPDTGRGGTPELERLAGDIRMFHYVFSLPQGVVFVFDHDDAGIAARDRIVKNHHYREAQHTLTLDPRFHPTLVGLKQVVIEDLVNLELHRTFFASSTPTCRVEYREGRQVRFQWLGAAKGEFCGHVLASAGFGDIHELVRLLLRTRQQFGFPSDPTVNEALNALDARPLR
jgi:hypothetical protein